MIRTKIVCTLGPSTDDDAIVRGMIQAGMNVARMNFSHGDHGEHGGRIQRVRRICKELGVDIPLLLDNKGPEVRLGDFAQGSVQLQKDAVFFLTGEAYQSDQAGATITFRDLVQHVQVGEHILADDGNIELIVESVENERAYCRVANGGKLSSRKSLHVPSASMHLPSLTQKDVDDLRFGVEQGVDFVALSFVRKADDVLQARECLRRFGGEDIRIIAKIENQLGVENIDEILQVSDGVMVARGDLGMDIPMEQIPQVQRTLIAHCYKCGKPAITATQMLDSMMRTPRPTRAEVNDVAGAIHEGTSAIMLSGETASGLYPVESVHMMANIARATENSIDYWDEFCKLHFDASLSVTDAICHATCTTAMGIGARAIVTVTKSGATARLISRYRPECPIIATTTSQRVRRQMALSWGVIPLMAPEADSTDELLTGGVQCATDAGLVEKGDVVVITAGVPVGISGTTNLIKVQVVGDVLLTGTGYGCREATGEVCVAHNSAEAFNIFEAGQILVMPATDDSLLPLMRQAAALIVEQEPEGNHAATVGLALEIPVITGAHQATQLLHPGTCVRVDPVRGMVESAECGSSLGDLGCEAREN